MSPDPFATLKSPLWDELEAAEAIGVGLAQPFTDAPDFNRQDDPEVDVTLRLPADRSHLRTPTRRLQVDYRADPDAYRHLRRLPKPGQSLHGVISGKYCMWAMVPALIERTGQGIRDLSIATLSYGKANAAELLGLVDDRRVRRVSLLVSYYFKAQNRALYDTLVPELRRRGHRCLAMRTHAKLLLAKMDDGTCYSCEGSANLRSSSNCEQFCLTNCPKLYRFHKSWIDHLLRGREEGQP